MLQVIGTMKVSASQEVTSTTIRKECHPFKPND
jgi:hypothetical protein